MTDTLILEWQLWLILSSVTYLSNQVKIRYIVFDFGNLKLITKLHLQCKKNSNLFMIFGADISDINITIWSLNIFTRILLVVYNTTAPPSFSVNWFIVCWFTSVRDYIIQMETPPSGRTVNIRPYTSVAPTSLGQWGSVIIVPHLLWDESSVSASESEGPSHLVGLYKKVVLRTYKLLWFSQISRHEYIKNE